MLMHGRILNKAWRIRPCINILKTGTVLNRKREADGAVKTSKDGLDIYTIQFDDGTTDYVDSNTIQSSIFDNMDNEGFTWLSLDCSSIISNQGI